MTHPGATPASALSPRQQAGTESGLSGMCESPAHFSEQVFFGETWGWCPTQPVLGVGLTAAQGQA
jgi:hypothetical protein